MIRGVRARPPHPQCSCPCTVSARSVSEKVACASEKGTYPAVVTSAMRRRFLRTVLLARGIPNPVFSFEEIGLEAKPALVGLAAP